MKVEQARIGADLATAQERLADLDANLTEWQEILELAATFATRCGDAYRKATDRTRKQFNAAVFERLDLKDGRICHEEYRPPFDDIFNVPEFEYETRERATGIEPAFSAWEALGAASPRCTSGSISAVQTAFLAVRRCPLVARIHPDRAPVRARIAHGPWAAWSAIERTGPRPGRWHIESLARPDTVP